MSADPQTQWSLAQRQAIEQRGADMLVSAGAGSGKTTVLVERVLRCLVEDGHDLTQLLIVTFTEAAAAEMRDRIRQRLMQALADARARNEEALARRMYRQLALLEQARISTLHSFCLDMVRRHFLRLGLEPGFRILEDDEAQLLRAELLQACLEEALAKDDPRFWRMLARFQAEDPARWFPLVEQVAAFARSQPDPCGWLRGVADRFTAEKHASDPLAPWRPAVFAWVSHHLAAARRQADDGAALAARDATLKKYAEALVQAAQALGSALQAAAACDWDGVLAAAAAAAAELDRRVRAGDSPWKEEVKAARARAKEAVRTVLEVLSRPQAEWAADIRELAPDVAAFVDFVTAFMASYQARKRRLGAVDFHDLEHFALAVLQDPESGEALRLRDEIVQVFVDEYQDISPIQDAILRAVARPGSLFVVGDVKQSIYRFRMAEPRLFLSAYETLSGGRGGVVVDLQDNYRSRPEVVAAVNFLFAQWFTRGFGGLDYDERARMRAGRKADDAPGDALGGAVEVHVIERNGAGDAEEAVADVDADAEVVAQEDDGSAADRDAVDGDAAAGGGADREALAGEDLAALEREAALVAWQIQHWMGRLPGSARRQVWDKELRRYRPLCWRDIVILLRSAAGRMNRVLEVLARAGIPAYGVTSSGFYEALEVRWLLSALAAIDNPRREIELVALMRSPMFAFTDVDLAQIRLAARGNYFDAVAQAARGAGVHAELAARCRGFLAQLDAWRTLARRAGAEAVLRQVLADTGLWSYLTGMPGGLARRANVELLLDRARWFDRTSVDGVFGFVAFAARALAAELDTGEARALGEHEDVVRVMTIHKSKGLEFPVVFVMDLGKQFRLSSRGSACLLHRDLGLGPQCVDEEGVRRWKSLPYIAIEHAERTESLAEEARILYVAMTRARDKLVLVGSCRDARRQVERARAVADASGGKPLPVDVMVSARTYLDWLLPAVVRCVSPDAAQAALLSLCVWDDTQPLPAAGTGTMVGAAAAAAGDLTGLYRALRAAAGDAGGQPLPAGEPAAGERGAGDVAGRAGEAVSQTRWSLDWQDPWAWTAGLPAKVSATDLRRLAAGGTGTAQTAARAAGSAADGRARASGRPWRAQAAARLLADPAFVAPGQPAAAAALARGTAFHQVLQHLDWRIEPTEEAVARALDDLVASGRLAADARQQVRLADICRFLRHPLAQRLRQARRVWREQPFYLRLPAGAPGAPPEHSVIVQGVIDCLAEEADGWLVVDYKTDEVTEAEAPRRAAAYHAQVAAYREAVRAATGAARVEAFVYFVGPGAAFPVPAVDLAAVWRAASARAEAAGTEEECV